MQLFQNLLVGIALDESGRHATPSSVKATLQARTLAQRFSSRVTLFHSSWNDRPQSHVVGGVLLRGGPMPWLRATLEELAEPFDDDGIAVEIAMGDQPPWLDMTRRVQRNGHDLVLVARRNLEEMSSRLFGTNAHKLLRKCPAPVWVVDPARPLLTNGIVAATDLSPVGTRAIRLGAELARAWKTRLHVVHALEVKRRQLAVGALTSMESTNRNIDATEESEIAVRARLQAELRPFESLKPLVHVAHGPPSRMIMDTIEIIDPDLVILGTVSRSGIPGLFIGNTAEKLLDKLDRSLLAVKPLDFVSPVSE